MDKISKFYLYFSVLLAESMVAVNLFMLWFLRPQYLEGVVDLIMVSVIGLIMWSFWIHEKGRNKMQRMVK